MNNETVPPSPPPGGYMPMRERLHAGRFAIRVAEYAGLTEAAGQLTASDTNTMTARAAAANCDPNPVTVVKGSSLWTIRSERKWPESIRDIETNNGIQTDGADAGEIFPGEKVWECGPPNPSLPAGTQEVPWPVAIAIPIAAVLSLKWIIDRRNANRK